MSAKFFLDTNIIIYAVEGAPQAKAKIASELMAEAIKEGTGVISSQVVQECLNAVTRNARIALTPELAEALLQGTLAPLCKVFPRSVEFFGAALGLQRRYKYSFYDSLIIAAALEAGCERLYSEDLQHGHSIGRLRIENPFVT